MVTRRSVKTSFEVCIFTVDFQYIIRFVIYLTLARGGGTPYIRMVETIVLFRG